MKKTHTKVQTAGSQRTGQFTWGGSVLRWLSGGWHRERLQCPRLLRMVFVSGSLVGISVGALGCSGDATTAPPPVSTTHLFWALQLNQHAVNLALQAPYNTMQLTATPLTVAGTPLTGVGQVTFHSSDSTVTVDTTTGLLTAQYVTSQTQVIATLQVNGVTLADTAYVQVTATALQPALATLSLQPIPGDSAKRSEDYIQNGLSWPATATDGAQNPICSASDGCPLLIYYTSSNQEILSNNHDKFSSVSPLSGGFSLGGQIGQTVLTATTWAYGVARRDSVVFTVGYLLNYGVDIRKNGIVEGNSAGRTPEPRRVVLGVGAKVFFHNSVDQKTGITFTDTTGMDTVTITNPLFGGGVISPDGRGNIAAFGADTAILSGVTCANFTLAFTTCYVTDSDFRARRFLTAKSYKFVTTLFPADTFELDFH